LFVKRKVKLAVKSHIVFLERWCPSLNLQWLSRDMRAYCSPTRSNCTHHRTTMEI